MGCKKGSFSKLNITKQIILDRFQSQNYERC